MKPQLWDCHMHSSFSADSDAPMEVMIQEAIKMNLPGICFTEHLDPDYPETPDLLDFSLDLPAYQETLLKLKNKYQRQIPVLFGIELGLQPHLSTYFHQLLTKYSFDFVIGSSHLVHGQDPYYPEFFHNRDTKTSYLEYFSSILENLDAFSEMDTYGHIDYIVRYHPDKEASYSFSEYEDILTAILEKLIQKEIALEINSGGYAYGLHRPNPCEHAIRRYHDLGGRLITIGADAHKPERIAYGFSNLPALLKECGFREYTVFQQRTPIFYPIQ